MCESLVNRGIIAAMLATAVAAVACSNGGRAMTPVTPTSASQVTGTAASSMASGDLSHGGGNQGGGDDRGRSPGRNEAEAEVKGTIAAGSLAGTCAARNLSFMVGATRVFTDAATRFDDTTCASLQAGSVIEAKGRRQADNSLLASRVEGQDEDENDEPEDED